MRYAWCSQWSYSSSCLNEVTQQRGEEAIGRSNPYGVCCSSSTGSHLCLTTEATTVSKGKPFVNMPTSCSNAGGRKAAFGQLTR
jgi:hypothetical protein